MALLSLYDILIAWRAGGISTERALHLAQIDSEMELTRAAKLSGVLPMDPLTPEEREHQALVDKILASVEDERA